VRLEVLGKVVWHSGFQIDSEVRNFTCERNFWVISLY
jgi:hypothetical protein